MNDFEENKELKNINKKTEDLFSSMERAENQERAMTAATISLYLKKRKHMEELVNASKGMDMFLTLIKEAAADKIPDNIPDNKPVIKQGEAVINAIDELIAAIQKYAAEENKFNDIVRTSVGEKDAYQKRLTEGE